MNNFTYYFSDVKMTMLENDLCKFEFFVKGAETTINIVVPFNRVYPVTKQFNENRLINRILSDSIDSLELRVRTINILKQDSIFTVQDLVNCDLDRLNKISNLGKRSIYEIKNVCNKRGLNLKF